MINEILHILSDPAHIVAEFAWEATFLALGVVIARRSARRSIRAEHRILDAEHGVDHHAWFFEDEEPIPYTLTEQVHRD